MASKRVISECITVRVNVGNFQHIEITKQASEEIAFSSVEERLNLEEGLTNDLVDSVIRSMRSIPSRLGKGVANAKEVEESICKAIPEWLNNNPPNLIDKAKDKANRASAQQKDEKDKASENILDVKEPEKASVKEKVIDNEDLFEDDEPQVSAKETKTVLAKSSPQAEIIEEAKVKESTVNTVSSDKESEDFDFFDDEDLDLFK